jgi:2-hydroxy-3-keto-5-methylthiopentenyl-1-phosphate phosphatase
MLGTVYIDFDATIAPRDPTDTLLDPFCDPCWRETAILAGWLVRSTRKSA